MSGGAVEHVVRAVACIDRKWRNFRGREIGTSLAARQKQVEIALAVGLADVFADGAAVDHEAAIVLAVAKQRPFDAVQLAIDAERKDQRALRHAAAFVMAFGSTRRKLLGRSDAGLSKFLWTIKPNSLP